MLLVPPGDADAKAAVAAIERSLRSEVLRVAAPGERLRGDAADGRDAARAAEAREAARSTCRLKKNKIKKVMGRIQVARVARKTRSIIPPAAHSIHSSEATGTP